MADKTIKIVYNNTTRRLTIPVHSAWTDFDNKLRNIFSIPTTQPIHVFYRDEDGDAITLNSDLELTELLASHNPSNGSLKMLLSTSPEVGGLDTAAWVFEGSISAHSERTIQSEPDVISVHSISSIDQPSGHTIASEPQGISEDVIEKESAGSDSRDMEDVAPSEDKGKGRQSWLPFEPLLETSAQSAQSAQTPQSVQPAESTQHQDETQQQPWAGLLNEFENLVNQFRDVLDNNPQLTASVSAIMDQIKHQIPISLDAFGQWLQSFRAEIHSPSQERPSTSDEKSSNSFGFTSTAPSFYMKTPMFTMSAGNPPPPAYSSNDASSARNETTTASTSDPTLPSKSVPGAYPEPQQRPHVYANNGGTFNFPPVPLLAPMPRMPQMPSMPQMRTPMFPFNHHHNFHGFRGFPARGGGHGHRGGSHGLGHFGYRHHGPGGPGGHEHNGFGSYQNWNQLRARQQSIAAQQQILAQQMQSEAASARTTDFRGLREQIHQTFSESRRLAREARGFSSDTHGDAKKEARHMEKELRHNLKRANKQLKTQIREVRKRSKGKMAWTSDSSSSESDSDNAEESHLPEMREKQNNFASSASATPADTTQSQQQHYSPTLVTFSSPDPFVPLIPNNHEDEALHIFRAMGITCSDQQLREMLERNNGDVEAVVNELFEA